MKEYRDGILLFEISDQKIWTKAIKDTLGLKNFYDENTNKWNWPNRINGEFFTAQSKKEIKTMNKKIMSELQKKIWVLDIHNFWK